MGLQLIVSFNQRMNLLCSGQEHFIAVSTLVRVVFHVVTINFDSSLLGFNINEACNVAPPIWLDWGHLAVSAYRHLRSMCIPYEQLIFMAAAAGYDLL